MAPTIPLGARTAIVPGEVTRGDIIAFHFPCEDDNRYEYVKRAIALGGDTVEIRCDIVFVNGQPVPSTLVDADHCTYDDQDPISEALIARDCTRYREKLGGKTYEVFGNPDPAHVAGQSPGDRDFPRLDGSLPRCPEGTGEPIGKLVDLRASGPCEQQRRYVVPAGYVFTIGDNRYSSNDSRFWGPVPLAKVTGIVQTSFGSRESGAGSRIKR